MGETDALLCFAETLMDTLKICALNFRRKVTIGYVNDLSDYFWEDREEERDIFEPGMILMTLPTKCTP